MDDTLCFTNHSVSDSFEKYGEAAPMLDRILKLNELSEKGWKIIIFTSRRMRTHSDDVEACYADIGLITTDWLDKFSVQWDELIFGKPLADFYIDDKSISFEDVLSWH